MGGMTKHFYYKEKTLRKNGAFSENQLFELALSRSFGLLLALYAGLLVVLSLTELCKHSGTCTLTLKPTKGAVEIFAFLDSYLCHYYFPPFVVMLL